MITIVQGERTEIKTRRATSRRARYSITAVNVHVLEVPRAHSAPLGQTLEMIAWQKPDMKSLGPDPDTATDRRGS